MHELNSKSRLDIVNTIDQKNESNFLHFTNAGATCLDVFPSYFQHNVDPKSYNIAHKCIQRFQPICCMILDIYVEIAFSGIYRHIFVLRIQLIRTLRPSFCLAIFIISEFVNFDINSVIPNDRVHQISPLTWFCRDSQTESSDISL